MVTCSAWKNASPREHRLRNTGGESLSTGNGAPTPPAGLTPGRRSDYPGRNQPRPRRGGPRHEPLHHRERGATRSSSTGRRESAARPLREMDSEEAPDAGGEIGGKLAVAPAVADVDTGRPSR